MAVQSPLLDNISVEGATGVLINIVGGPDLKLREMEEAAGLIQQQAHEDANIIWGASVDESMGETVKVTVIATGFDREVTQPEARPQSALRPVASQVPQSFASMPVPRAASQPAPQASVRSLSREEGARALSARRSNTAMFTQGAQQGLPMREPVRDRVTMPSALDSEWDTPTFQRKGGQ